MSNPVLGVIPVRLGSTRLPRKPLALIGGIPMVIRVWQQASKAKMLSALVIATCDQEIAEECDKVGAKVIMTSEQARTGSDRVAEAYQAVTSTEGFSPKDSPYAAVCNIQGDMPLLNPKVIDHTIESLLNSSETFQMSTVAIPIIDQDEFLRPSAVKVAVGEENRALYFSRAPIPFTRDQLDPNSISEEYPYGYKHIGLYVFRPGLLETLPQLKPSLLEEREKLEQLRILAAGYPIRVALTSRKEFGQSIEVDTPEDLLRANELCSLNKD